MYWIHRFGYKFGNQIISLCSILKNKKCLITGGNNFVDKDNPSYNPDLISAVESGDADKVQTLTAGLEIDPIEAEGLVNFTKMQPDDIVLVLPSVQHFALAYCVKIKSPAKSILQVPEVMQEKFINRRGEQINFDPSVGFKYFVTDVALNAGFFHEIELLNEIPYGGLKREYNFKEITIPIHDVGYQKYIEQLASKPVREKKKSKKNTKQKAEAKNQAAPAPEPKTK